MITQCAWCEPTPVQSQLTTHGICPTCAAKLLAEVGLEPEPEESAPVSAN